MAETSETRFGSCKIRGAAELVAATQLRKCAADKEAM